MESLKQGCFFFCFFCIIKFQYFVIRGRSPLQGDAELVLKWAFDPNNIVWSIKRRETAGLRMIGNMNMQFLMDNKVWFLIGLGVLAAVILVLLILHAVRPLSKRMETKIRKRRYIRIDDFLESWRLDKSDFPGCYVILIYDRKLILNPMHYDDIYVGQSVNVRKRVFSHLMGHGNGNVYYSLKSGCKVYVLIEKCSRKKLNRNEIDLINYFQATESLNMTRGGAAKR